MTAGNDASTEEDTTTSSSGEAPTKVALGSTVKLPSSSRVNVTRPDGETVTVTGGVYVVQQPGTYTIGTRNQRQIEVS